MQGPDRHIDAGVSGHCYCLRSVRMFEMPMAAPNASQPPTISLQQADQFSNLQPASSRLAARFYLPIIQVL